MNISNYNPGANAYVYGKFKIDNESKFACGSTTLRAEANVWKNGNAYVNYASPLATSATLRVYRAC